MADTDSYSPIAELNLLKDFEAQGRSIADGFELFEYGDTSALEAGGLDDPDFLGRLIPFAKANFTGSFYALWRLDDRADLATLPVVVFGDEGGVFVVARTLRELLQLLAYDREISVWPDEAYFARHPDDHQPSRGHEDYVAWLDQQFGLSAAVDPNAVVDTAQADLGERFDTWITTVLQT